MGTNRACAREVVAALLDDVRTGDLDRGEPASGRLIHAIARSSDLTHWRAIDEHERAQGRAAQRARVKLVHREHMRQISGKEAAR